MGVAKQPERIIAPGMTGRKERMSERPAPACEAGRCAEPSSWATVHGNVRLCAFHAAQWAPAEPITPLEAVTR